MERDLPSGLASPVCDLSCSARRDGFVYVFEQPSNVHEKRFFPLDLLDLLDSTGATDIVEAEDSSDSDSSA